MFLGLLTLFTVVMAVELPTSAQVPAPPAAGSDQPIVPGTATPAPASPTAPQSVPVSQAQADKEWLTAYFMVHEGYRLQHMKAIEATLNKMTPTQLHTLRDMYDQKHSLQQQQQQIFNQWNAYQVNRAQAWNQRQQRQLNQVSAEESQSASLEERQINQMHEEAAANAEMKNLSYPGNFGPYGGGYGGGYIHPYFNPLGGPY